MPQMRHPPVLLLCLSDKGGAIGALAHCGVSLVSGHLDLIKSAVIIACGMILALVYGAFDMLVVSTGLVIHNDLLSVKD